MSATQVDPDRGAFADDMAALEAAVAELTRSLAGASEGLATLDAVRLRSLRDDLASHALAARLLVGAGASDDVVTALLARANRLSVAVGQGVSAT